MPALANPDNAGQVGVVNIHSAPPAIPEDATPHCPACTSDAKRWALLRCALARGFALFLGGIALLGIVGAMRNAGFDANLWWVDVRAFPKGLSRSLLAGSALLLLAFGFRPPIGRWRGGLTGLVTAVLAWIAVANGIVFLVLWARGAIAPGVPVPLSFGVAALLGLVAQESLRSEPRVRVPGWRVGMACVGCAVVFPLAQVFCFGKTDYSRPAQAALVFGARAYADGRPSDALADRVRTACDLYRGGLVRELIFSGGPGDGDVTEPEAMRRLALRLGVPDRDIRLDPAGLNTAMTVRNAARLAREHHLDRILAVSHFYHLPRIKLAGQRAGIDVLTVPARESYFLRQTPYSVLREVPAWWAYYLRAILA
jgi:vancomycin permeability regulator SanA